MLPCGGTACSRDGIRLKLKIFSQGLAQFQAIALHVDDAVPDNPHRGIRVHRIHHVSQFVWRPPVVSVEK